MQSNETVIYLELTLIVYTIIINIIIIDSQ